MMNNDNTEPTDLEIRIYEAKRALCVAIMEAAVALQVTPQELMRELGAMIDEGIDEF